MENYVNKLIWILKFKKFSSTQKATHNSNSSLGPRAREALGPCVFDLVTIDMKFPSLFSSNMIVLLRIVFAWPSLESFDFDSIFVAFLWIIWGFKIWVINQQRSTPKNDKSLHQITPNSGFNGSGKKWNKSFYHDKK